MAGRGPLKVAVPVAAVGVAIAALLLATCGSPDAPAATATVPATTTTASTSTTTTTTVPATTTTTSTSTTSTSTTSTTTSTTSTTSTSTTSTVPSLQETAPITPPSDSHAAEPVIELGWLSIPKIGVEMPIYEGIRMTTLELGPGHWPGTAMPGQIGNVVIGGHRTSKHKVFRKIDELVPGDEILFGMPEGQITYIVNRVEIVYPDAL